MTLLPAGRLFAYDPAGTPGAPPARGATVTNLTIYQNSDGTFRYELAGTSTVVHVELWPASAQGLFVVPDGSAGRPAVGGVAEVDLAKLPAGGQWWVAAVVVGPDGQSMTQAVAIQTGAAAAPSNALGWLISKL